MFRAVIFDFDGVITDTEILHLRAFNRVLAQFGIEITPKEYYKVYLGYTDVDCYKLLIDFQQPLLDQQFVAIEVTETEIVRVIILCGYLDAVRNERLIERPQVQNLGIGNNAIKVKYYSFDHKILLIPNIL